VIRVSSLVVDDIATEVMKRFDAIPGRGRGAEVGGILLGRREENEIIVDDFEPVLCDHRLGPSFRLSDSDRIGWRKTLQHIRQRGLSAIVGCYRTDTSQELALREDDRELLETELQQDGDVILLIRPSRSQPYEAKLFLRDDGQLRELPQATYFAFDRRAASLVRLPSGEPPVTVERTAWTEAPDSLIEEQFSNPSRHSESFDHGNDSMSREVAPTASVEHDEPQSPPAGRTSAREPEPEPEDSVSTPRVETEPEHSPLIQTASEDEQPAPERRPEFEPIGPLARRRLLAEQPPEEPKRRKWSFISGAVLLAAMGGTLGYYSLTPRPAAPESTRPAEQASAPSDTSRIAPALQPAQASPSQPAETESTVQPRSATEDEPIAADTDRQVRLFLNKWADAKKSTNIGEVEDFYAPKLSRYFKRRGVTRADVRAARAKDDARYGRMIICNIKDISVNPLDSSHAVATFRKRWQTAGPRVFMGEEQEQLTLVRDQGKWQIGAEQRTKLYWERKEHYAPASRPARTAR